MTRLNRNGAFAWLAVFGSAVAAGCPSTSDNDTDDPMTTAGDSSTGGPDSASTVAPSGSGEPTGSESGSGSTETGSDSDSDSSSTGDPGDPGLEEWPELYQDFIHAVGGSNFVDVDGVQMHYIETGDLTSDQTVLVLHGIPSHTFLWRDVLPSFDDKRVIAVDLVGYGRSDRPGDVDYRPPTHVQFLAGFADALDLQDVHLVTHDLGGITGMRWAAEHPDRVASITMFETIWATIPSVANLPPPFSDLIAGLRDPKLGPVLVGEMNVFLGDFDPFTVNGVDKEIEAVYQHAFPDAQDRIDVILPSGPLAFPFAEDPEAEAFVQDYVDYLIDDDVPKLVIDVPLGPVSNITVDEAGTVRMPAFAEANFPNVTLAELGNAGHFCQEDAPSELGELINDFIDGV